MVICSVRYCHNSSENGYRLFGFPLNDENKLEKWKKNMCNPSWKVNRKTKICEAHFLENSFEFEITVTLREDAAPTIFKPTEFISKQSLNIFNKNDLISKLEELQSTVTQRENEIRALQSEIANFRTSQK